MKKLVTIVVGAALTAFAAACSTNENTTTNTNAGNMNAVVNTNANANANANVANANANANARRTYNANISEEEYNKEKERYGQEAKQGGETIGQGLKDGWLWVKTKGTLATVNDLRDSTINVDVDNAVVTLRGSVANKQQEEAAVKAAKGVSGVKSVTDKLQIKPGEGLIMNSNNSNANKNANHNK